jgi:hypothetical protein
MKNKKREKYIPRNQALMLLVEIMKSDLVKLPDKHIFDMINKHPSTIRNGLKYHLRTIKKPNEVK